MTKKHLAIEVLLRALWIIEGLILYSFISSLSENIYILALGCFLTVIGFFYVFWTFIFLAKAMFTKKLVTYGPYSYSRHQMYVSMYIILVGIGLSFFSYIWFVILLIFIPFWYLDCKIEEKQMTDLHGEKYLEYKKKVGMFFPKR